MLQLRRITSTGRFVPEIDGLRFAAIAAVVLYHFHGFAAANYGAAGHDFFAAAAEHGYRGVNIFYVISGFVLGLPFATQHLTAGAPVRVPAYFLRRLTRLEPPYILNLLICFAAMVWSGTASAAALFPHLAASLLYMHNLWFGEHSTINPVAWTLEVEVQFYCAAPLLASIFRVKSTRLRRSILALTILLAGIIQMIFWDAGQRVQLTLLFAIQFFLAGFLLADVYLVSGNRAGAGHWAWDLVSLAGWPLVFLPGDRLVWTSLPFLIVILHLATFRGKLFRRFFTAQAITTIGGMCYSIYLFHYVLIPGELRVFGRVAAGFAFNAYFSVQLILYSAVLLLVAGSYFVLIERPCMRKDWPRRLLARLRG